MVTMTGVYEGDKHCKITHGPSGNVIFTDAPKDNNGRGEAFSPTDLIGASLGSCIVTTMAIYGEKNGMNLKGANFHVTKKMKTEPRQIHELALEITLPENLSADERVTLEKIAHTCPVARSLSSEVNIPVVFHYKTL